MAVALAVALAVAVVVGVAEAHTVWDWVEVKHRVGESVVVGTR